MRKFNTAIILVLAGTFAITTAFSQSENFAFTNTSTSKKTASAKNAYSKNVKVDRAFAKNFINARNISWKETAEEYIANFKTDDRIAIAWFTKTGGLYCVNYYGTDSDLPETEREIIAQKYPDYHPTATLEIHKGNVIAYVVTIQSCNMQKKIKIVNGEMEEMESLKLAR